MDEHPSTLISISTTFFPGAPFPGLVPDDSPADLLIHTGDSVFFYVHKSLILSHSSNYFNGFLFDDYVTHSNASLQPTANSPSAATTIGLRPMSPIYYGSNSSSPTARAHSDSPYDNDHRSGTSSSAPAETVPYLITIPESSPVLNILLHLIYNLPCERFSPDLETLTSLFSCLKKYGLSVQDLIPPNSEITNILLSHAPKNPLQIYTLAAANKLEQLCVAASHFTLPISLSQVTDSQSLMMGPIYLKRLFFLHMGRAEALKRTICVLPEPHPPLPNCDHSDQKAITRAWSLVTAFVINSEMLQCVSTGTLATSYGPLANSTKCESCKTALRNRILAMVQSWSLVKTTI